MTLILGQTTRWAMSWVDPVYTAAGNTPLRRGGVSRYICEGQGFEFRKHIIPQPWIWDGKLERRQEELKGIVSQTFQQWKKTLTSGGTLESDHENCLVSQTGNELPQTRRHSRRESNADVHLLLQAQAIQSGLNVRSSLREDRSLLSRKDSRPCKADRLETEATVKHLMKTNLRLLSVLYLSGARSWTHQNLGLTTYSLHHTHSPIFTVNLRGSWVPVKGTYNLSFNPRAL